MFKQSKVRFVRAGHGPDSPIMYVIIMNRTEHGNWKVETCPCDNTGSPVNDPVFWDIFSSQFAARHCMNQQYKEWFEVANWRY